MVLDKSPLKASKNFQSTYTTLLTFKQSLKIDSVSFLTEIAENGIQELITV
jgi:hypothetical protein